MLVSLLAIYFFTNQLEVIYDIHSFIYLFINLNKQTTTKISTTVSSDLSSQDLEWLWKEPFFCSRCPDDKKT